MRTIFLGEFDAALAKFDSALSQASGFGMLRHFSSLEQLFDMDGKNMPKFTAGQLRSACAQVGTALPALGR